MGKKGSSQAEGGRALGRVLRLLADAGLTDDEHLRDALWLSQYLPEYPLEEPGGRQTAPTPVNDAPPDSGAKSKRGTPEKAPTPAAASRPAGREPAPTKLFPAGDFGSGTRAASPVYVPAGGVLPRPLDLARALRPFGRRRAGLRRVLDEGATVTESAATSERRLQITPKYVGEPERWFSLALIFDDAQGMAPWRKTAVEFQKLLGGLGFFRDVRQYWLCTGNEPRLRTASGCEASPEVLRDPSGRTVVLVLTNGVGGHWQAKPLLRVLEGWAQCGPVAVCSLLPPNRWVHTDIGSVNRWVQAPTPGVRNGLLRLWDGSRVVTAEPGATPFPVFSLTKEGLEAWAAMQMSQRRARAAAVVLSPEWGDEQPELPLAVAGYPNQDNVARRLREFAAIASPDAKNLLRYLSAVPLTLPIMRLVQSAMLPADSPLSAMSEVLMSGLIKPRGAQGQGSDPDHVVYDFVEGAREELRSLTGIEELEQVVLEVRDELRRFIEEKLGFAIPRLEAWVMDPAGGKALPAEVQHFVEVMSASLAALGYAGRAEAAEVGAGAVTVLYAGRDRNQRSFRLLEELLRREGLREPRFLSEIEWLRTEWIGELRLALERTRVLVLVESPAFLRGFGQEAEFLGLLRKHRTGMHCFRVPLSPIRWDVQEHRYESAAGPRPEVEPLSRMSGTRQRAAVARLARAIAGAAGIRNDEISFTGEVQQLLDEVDLVETKPQRRAEIGRRLAKIGDPRRGVGLINGIPDIVWRSIPGGEVTIEKHGTFAVEPFRMAAYPVTQAQYRAFLESQDFGDPRWWKGLKRRESDGRVWRETDHNCPATEVSWYEAVAFCRWLSAKLRFEVRLPTEWEWQWAAQSAQPEFEYPWGRKWIKGYANTNESGIRGVTAGGMFPQGDSAQGVSDLAGNVWEWCLNEYGKPKRIQTSGEEWRLVRGGSWYYYPDYARARNRYYYRPDDRYNLVGFRVVCSSPSSTER